MGICFENKDIKCVSKIRADAQSGLLDSWNHGEEQLHLSS